MGTNYGSIISGLLGIIAGEDIEFKANGNDFDWCDFDVNQDVVDIGKFKYRIKKPAPASLLSRIEKEYGEYEVVELGWDAGFLRIICEDGAGRFHTVAQSMKGFYQYVYEYTCGDKKGQFYAMDNPTCSYNKQTDMPVAALFTK